MCGIALLLSGINWTSLSVPKENQFEVQNEKNVEPPENQGSMALYPTLSDLKEVLRRRGPDHIGLEMLQLHIASTLKTERLEGIKNKLEDSLHTAREDLHGVFLDEQDHHSMRATNVIEKKKREFEKHELIPDNCICYNLQEVKKSIDTILVGQLDDKLFDSFVGNNIPSMLFLGATLQLRGTDPVFQPRRDLQSNVLVYNGEIFGGINVENHENDTAVLMDALQDCCSCPCHASEVNCCCVVQCNHISVPELLSTIRGPWSLIYWQESSKILWFGRDALGRRSLLAHWPSASDPRFVLSSVAPPSVLGKFPEKGQCHGYEDAAKENIALEYWDELECGIYSLSLESRGGIFSQSNDSCINITGTLKKLNWSDPFLRRLLDWERSHIEPNHSNDTDSLSQNFHTRENNFNRAVICQTFSVTDSCDSAVNAGILDATLEYCVPSKVHQQQIVPKKATEEPSIPSACKVLSALKQAVMRRACQRAFNEKIDGGGMKQRQSTDIAVLFSGGLDSMILAALLDKCLATSCEIDLLNVSFDGASAPDRISAKSGVSELRRIAPSRRWRLVEIDADPSNMLQEMNHLTSIILPANTYMDLNIGTALCLAAHGDGWVEDVDSSNEQEASSCHSHFQNQQILNRRKYKSSARILLVGAGADEQCAGYGRHRTKFRAGGWSALQHELKIDFQRIWKRNLGRDDRCIADNGKEARFPFLDEDVVGILLDLPLWEIADLGKPSGEGDKEILRQVALMLGLTGAASMPKRAIQFGSRIARESNKKNFGSNRAANQASAGSVVLPSFTK